MPYYPDYPSPPLSPMTSILIEDLAIILVVLGKTVKCAHIITEEGYNVDMFDLGPCLSGILEAYESS